MLGPQSKIFIYLCPGFNLCDQLDLVRFLETYHFLSRRLFQSWNLFTFIKLGSAIEITDLFCTGQVDEVAIIDTQYIKQANGKKSTIVT